MSTKLITKVLQPTYDVRTVLLCLIDPRVRKIRNEAPSCPGIFSVLFAFTMSLSPSVSPSPIFLTDTELQDRMQLQQDK